MEWQSAVETIGIAVDVVGVGIIVGGIIIATVRIGRHADGDTYRRYRQSVGRSILLGLELLVAGDIIRTVATEPTFRSVGILAAIVGIRTFLSFTLELELTGRWPWQRSPRATAAEP